LGSRAGQNAMGGPRTTGQLGQGGDQLPPLPPALRTGEDGPKLQLCISDVISPPKAGWMGRGAETPLGGTGPKESKAGSCVGLSGA